MKSHLIKSSLCIILCSMLASFNGFTQTSQTSFKDDNLAFRKEMNDEFRDTAQSPLTKEGLLVFKEIEFFPIRSKYKVVAKLVLTPDEKPFEMPRSKGNTGTYRKYGVATFMLDGKECKLSVYQFMKLINNPKYKNELFLPFKDLTSGKQTYGGGRFLDLTIPEGDEIVIDFNKAYNPPCAFTPYATCPLPPLQNRIAVRVEAGELKYGDH